MNNYDYCTDWAERYAHTLEKDPSALRVLDYGCGRGTLLQMLLGKGFIAAGCDIFANDNYKDELPTALVNKNILREMKGDCIPFADASFDVIVSNQVLEHVKNLDAVMAEMHRVLKPGGIMLHLFPYQGSWREDHVKLPFLHWLPKDERVRVPYARALRTLGFGRGRHGKTPDEWAWNAVLWVDQWTCYRDMKTLKRTWSSFNLSAKHIESDWLEQRAPFGGLTKMLPDLFKNPMTRLGGCVVVTLQKPNPVTEPLRHAQAA